MEIILVFIFKNCKNYKLSDLVGKLNESDNDKE